MNHLSEERLYNMAQKLVRGDTLTAEDEAAVEHMMKCKRCYDLLEYAISLIELSDHMAWKLTPPPPRRKSLNATFQLVIRQTDAALKQLLQKGQSWLFDYAVPPGRYQAAVMGYSSSMSVAGNRDGHSSTAESRKQKPQTLEDLRDEDTQVSYDPEKGLLTVQIRSDGDRVPACMVCPTDGDDRFMEFEFHNGLYRGEMSGLDNGEYTLILER